MKTGRYIACTAFLPLISAAVVPAEDCEMFPALAEHTAEPRLALTVGHGDQPVTRIELAPDKSFAATASWDSTVKLWSLDPLAQINTLSGHGDWVRSIDISADSRSIVSGGNDGTVRVWDAESGRVRLRYAGHARSELETVTAVAFVGSNWIASAGYDGTFRLLDRNTCALTNLLRLDAAVNDILVPGDGRLIIGDDVGRIHYLEVDEAGRLKQTRSIETGAASIAALTQTPAGQLIVARLDHAETAILPGSIWVYDPIEDDGRRLDAELLGEIPFLRYDAQNGILHYADMTGYFQTELETGTRILGVYHGLISLPFALHPGSECVLLAVNGALATFDFGADRVCAQTHAQGAATAFVHVEGDFLMHGGPEATIWDLQAGRPIAVLGDSEELVQDAVFLPGQRVATVGFEQTFDIWSVYGGEPIVSHDDGSGCGLNLVRYFPEENALISGYGTILEDDCSSYLQVRDIDSGEVIRRLELESRLTDLFAGPRTDRLMVSMFPSTWAEWDLHEMSLRPIRFGLYGVQAIAYSPDRSMILAGTEWSPGSNRAFLLQAASLNPDTALPGHRNTVTSVAYLPDGRGLLTGGSDGQLRSWTVAGKPLNVAVQPVGITRLAVRDGLVFTGGADGGVQVWDRDRMRLLATLYAPAADRWVVVAPDGRFDTNRFDESLQLNWVLPDSPFVPVPLEIYLREFYEPRLLARLIAGERMRSVPLLAELDRRQPTIEITRIQALADDPGRVDVSVRFDVQEGASIRDLKLFRNGQLVGRYPPDGGEIDLNNGRQTVFTGVRLPTQSKSRDVEFSAYAFNGDGIKSATARATYTIPNKLEPRPRRAFLVMVGINEYENPAWRLRYAVADANRLAATLRSRLEATGRFEEILETRLVTQESPEGVQPTWGRIRDLLSGLSVQDGERPTPAPDDLLVIAFAGHGYAGPDGEFHLFPFDIGPGVFRTVNDSLLESTITSDDLEAWLQPIDAGEIVMILDTCNSAAVVVGRDFKPGPMGSSGLGQLAYNKGIRLLAATQAENVAFESSELLHGVLTYALTVEGLEASKADFRPADDRITMGEWLAYGVERVPQLYKELLEGRFNDGSRGVRAIRPEPERGQAGIEDSQRPVLFDFRTVVQETVLQ